MSARLKTGATKKKPTELWKKITILCGTIGRQQTSHYSTLPTLVSTQINKYMKLIFATSDPMQSISAVCERLFSSFPCSI